ncbi:MAG: STAS domain-containing protein [Candidatus Riflebacteria bacterium]|nr:STAS domain-containing protein [Candidatus Riflebacteria bacterium]
MEIVTAAVDGVVYLEFKGRLDAESAPGASQTVQDLLKTPCSKLLIDLGGLAYISSAGIRVLLLAAQGLRRAGGQLAVCGARGEVKDIIQVSGLGSVITVVEGRDQARALLEEPRP